LGADLDASVTVHLQRLGESLGCCKVARSQRCHDLCHRAISVYVARPLDHQCVRSLGTDSVAIMYRHEEFFRALLTSMPVGIVGVVRRCAARANCVGSRTTYLQQKQAWQQQNKG
jgi:hypothetical protein